MDTPLTPEFRRLRWVARALTLGFLVVAGRLVHLQVFEHEELERMAAIRQVREMKLIPLRGPILDRSGAELVTSEERVSVGVNPRKLQDPTLAAAML